MIRLHRPIVDNFVDNGIDVLAMLELTPGGPCPRPAASSHPRKRQSDASPPKLSQSALLGGCGICRCGDERVDVGLLFSTKALTMIRRTVQSVCASPMSFPSKSPWMVECIDPMYLNMYVPALQYPACLVGYVQHELGLPIASTAPLAKITERFAVGGRRFAQLTDLPWPFATPGQTP